MRCTLELEKHFYCCELVKIIIIFLNKIIILKMARNVIRKGLKFCKATKMSETFRDFETIDVFEVSFDFVI